MNKYPFSSLTRWHVASGCDLVIPFVGLKDKFVLASAYPKGPPKYLMIVRPISDEILYLFDEMVGCVWIFL